MNAQAIAAAAPPMSKGCGPCTTMPCRAASPVKDPVCGMSVDPHATPHRHEHRRADLPFLLRRLPHQVRGRPGALPWRQGAGTGARPDAIYTCPMHPEVRQVGPGTCPICGMALEPLDVTAEAGPNPELADMTRRFWIGLVLALPVLAARDGRASHQPAHALGAAARQLAAAPPGDTGRALGRVAVLRARLGVA